MKINLSLLFCALTIFYSIEGYSTSNQLCGDDRSFGFEKLNSVDVNLLLTSSKESNKEQFIANLTSAFPELHFVILEYSQIFSDYKLPEKSLKKIVYSDERISNGELEFIKTYTSKLGNFGGANIHPNVFADGFILSKHVIALPNNAPKESIIHEVLHFLFWKARNPKQGSRQYLDRDDWINFNLASKYKWTEEQTSEFSNVRKNYLYFFPEYLNSLRSVVGEHLDISIFLLRNGKNLGISEDELGRSLHLFENMYLSKHRGIIQLDSINLQKMMSETVEYYKLPELDSIVWSSIIAEIQDSREFLLCLQKEFSLNL